MFITKVYNTFVINYCFSIKYTYVLNMLNNSYVITVI